MNIVSDVKGVFGQVTNWAESQWRQRLVQVSVYGGLIFYLLSTGSLIDQVDKGLHSALGLKLGKDGTRALHGVVFALLMYAGARFILDPLVSKLSKDMEGFKADKELEDTVVEPKGGGAKVSAKGAGAKGAGAKGAGAKGAGAKGAGAKVGARSAGARGAKK